MDSYGFRGWCCLNFKVRVILGIVYVIICNWCGYVEFDEEY